MKITTLFFVCIICSLSASGYAQNYKVSIKKQDSAIIDILKEIEENSEFTFFYNDNQVNARQKASVNVKNATIEEVLDQVLKNTNYNYQIIDRQVLLKMAENNLPSASQQSKTVTGTVTDETGEPIIGANVVEKGTTNGTITDVEGIFTLPVGNHAILQISYIGYTMREVTIENQISLHIRLKDDFENLEEVIVVGYGTQKKVNLTGSVSTIQGNQLAKRNTAQTSQALQGLAPGLSVVQNSGQPGSAANVRVRGVGTLGDTNPLILIDGIEGDINNVNASDIESISVLKDAASAAIYGSRAANGVILVTTHRAAQNKIDITFGMNLGVQGFTDLPQFLGGLDYINMRNEANINEGKGQFYTDEYIQNYIAHSPSDEYPDTDWQKEVYTNSGFQQSYSLGLNGGTEKARLFASLHYLNQEGKVENTGFDRYGIRVNTDILPMKGLTVSLDLNGSFTKNQEPGMTVSQIFYQTNRIPPIWAAYYENGSRLSEGNLGNNPVAQALGTGRNDYKNTDLSLNAKVAYEIIEGLKASVTLSPQVKYVKEKNFVKKCEMWNWNSTSVFYTPAKTTLTQTSKDALNMNIKALLSYEKTWSRHSVSALGGYEQVYYSNNWFSGYREEFEFDQYDVLNAGSVENQQAKGTGYEWALRSYFGRLNYNYMGKYLLEANIRYDGSSRFNKSNNFGVFPSFSVGWRISEESFMKQLTWLSNLKIMASWGALGNQNIGNYPYLSVINLTQNHVFGKTPVNGAAQLVYANKDITWESTEVTNIGLDFGIFNGKIHGTFEYYIKNTKDILLNLPIPMTTGLSASEQNAGKVRNRGWDLTLGYRDKRGEIDYAFSFILSDVKNKVVSLSDGGPFYSSYTITKEGLPIYALYGYVAEGLFQSQEEIDAHAKQFGTVGPGDIKYKDLNNDGVITASEDRTMIGKTFPRFAYSGTIDLGYKNFDISIFIQGVGKKDSYLEKDAVMAFYNGGKVSDYHLDRWTPENPNAGYPRLTISYPNNQQVSSYWKKSAAYVRIKNMVIGYSLPRSILSKTFIKNARIYLSGDNLLTFDSFYKGWDPEAPLGDGVYYPQTRTFSVGINVNF